MELQALYSRRNTKGNWEIGKRNREFVFSPPAQGPAFYRPLFKWAISTLAMFSQEAWMATAPMS